MKLYISFSAKHSKYLSVVRKFRTTDLSSNVFLLNKFLCIPTPHINHRRNLKILLYPLIPIPHFIFYKHKMPVELPKIKDFYICFLCIPSTHSVWHERIKVRLIPLSVCGNISTTSFLLHLFSETYL